MVAASRFLLLAALVAGVSTQAKEPSDYHIGETIEADIVTPVPLHVVNATGTAAMQVKEAGRMPLIFKFDPTIADQAERELRDDFALTRSNFLKRVQRTFKQAKLDPETLAQTNFTALVKSFQKGNKGFPLTPDLATIWASGDAGRVFQSSVVARFRATQERPIRLGALPPLPKPGPRILLVTMGLDEPLTVQTAVKRGKSIPRTNVVSVMHARADLTASFPAADRVVAKYVAGLIRQNSAFQPDLTQLTRVQKTNKLVIADHFEAGQVIAKQGQTVDPRIKGILDELNERTVATKLAAKVDEEQARVERIKARAEQFQIEADESQVRANVAQANAVTAQKDAEAAKKEAEAAQANADRIRKRNQYLAAGLAVSVVGGVFLFWRLMRRKQPSTLLPARVAGSGLPATVVACPSCDETIVISTATGSSADLNWQQKAQAAERRAQQAQAALRAGAFAQLSHWLKHQFSQRLLTERTQMLDSQKAAAAELAELERRLDELHAPLQERLRAYEKRVAELEKSLAEKGQENRQLLEAKIQLTRKQMEAERARTTMELN